MPWQPHCTAIVTGGYPIQPKRQLVHSVSELAWPETVVVNIKSGERELGRAGSQGESEEWGGGMDNPVMRSGDKKRLEYKFELTPPLNRKYN